MKIYVTVKFGGKPASASDEEIFNTMTNEEIIAFTKKRVKENLAEELGCELAEHISTEIIRD